MGRLNPTMDPQTFKDSAVAQKPLIESADTKQLGLGTMTLDRWQTLVQQLVELKVIDKPVDAQRSFAEPSKAK
jgi:NitT/TauT family transport system substrate-binding protein